GDDVERRIDLAGAVEADRATRQLEILAEQREIAAHHLERADDDRRGAGSRYRDLAAPFAVEAATADEDLAGQLDDDVERRRQHRRRFSRFRRRRWRSL